MAGRTAVVPARPTLVLPPPAQLAASGKVLDYVSATMGEDIPGETLEEKEAWLYFQRLTEVTTLTNAVAGLMSQCRFYIGTWDAKGEDQYARDPETKVVRAGLDSTAVAAAEDALARVTDEAGSQRSLISSQSQVWTVTGDGYLIGYWIDAKGDPAMSVAARVQETFRFVARGCLRKKGDGYEMQAEAKGPWINLPGGIVIRRMRVDDPRFPGQGQAWVRSSLEVCRDLYFFGLAARAGAKSNLPADVWVVPAEASPKDLNPEGIMAGGGGALSDGAPGDTGNQQSFAVKLEEMLGTFVSQAVTEAASGNGVIPAFLSIEERLVKSFEKLSFARDIDPQIKELVDQARARLSDSAPCAPETLSGIGDTNRWNGKQISADSYRQYYRPLALAMSDAWTAQVLYPDMRTRGISADRYKPLRVMVDASAVIAPTDPRELANDGVRVMAIGPSGWRKLVGVSDEYAPTDEELPVMLAARVNPDSHAKSGSGRGDQGPPSETQPVKAAGRLSAGGAPVDTFAALTRIEFDVRSRLEEAAAAALDDAVNRTGAKLKSWARQAKMGAELPSSLDLIDSRDMARVLGSERALALVSSRPTLADESVRREDLFAAALVSLLARFEVLVRQGYAKAEGVLGVTVAAEDIDANVERGKAALRAGMMLVADRELFGVGAPDEDVGEQVAGMRVPTNVLYTALAAAGGAVVAVSLRPTPANTHWVAVDGTVVLPALMFGPTLAKFAPPADAAEWVYGDEYRSRAFEPHHALDGVVVTAPDDPALSGSPFSAFAGFYTPGDHGGCRCLLVPKPKEG